ncbi:MAG: alanine--tRNA ligase, partial [Nitrospirae bacterium]|nr:alanine--tRNA ligase [Nitrospirota bacterium]
EVLDTLKPVPDLFFHQVRILQGKMFVNHPYHLKVDAERRKQTARNHTATHLLHAVLRETLGDHVKQAGSYVGPERLRFDFNHFVGLTEKEKEKIEETVNDRILANVSVHSDVMGIEEALNKGALAFFGDKYGEEVRVVQIKDEEKQFSQELCGGTHCRATGDIGLFKILAESSVASGVRRIEAITGKRAYRDFKAVETILKKMAEKLKTNMAEVSQKLDRFILSDKEREREISALKAKALLPASEAQKPELQNVDGLSVLIRQMDNMNPKELRLALDTMKRPNIDLIILGSAQDEKVSLIAHLSPAATKRLHAGEIIKNLSLLLEGTGGGKPELAQGGGKHPEKLNDVLSKSESIIHNLLKIPPR